MSGPESNRPRYRLLKTLEHSQKEAVASAGMTASCDNFMNAFALFLKATPVEMGALTGFPQLVGSLMQLVSVFLGTRFSRRRIVLIAAMLQTLLMLGFAALAALRKPDLVQTLLVLVMAYHAFVNLIQPQWRAWMGSLVPQQQRGAFFASRTRLTMATTLFIFIGGGLFLSFSARYNMVWAGFVALFLVAAIGRASSCYHLWKMHDPAPEPGVDDKGRFFDTLRILRESFHDPTFRNYTFFVAGMQGMVAISAPFFAVYMLNELEFTYFEYTINLIASIATQFTMLKYWGRFSDRHGARFVMLMCASAIPVIPVLWLFSGNYYYLLWVQLISGLAWSGYNLTMANYLYDIRPHHTNFATYAAVQALTSAVMVFFGGIGGGYLAAHSPAIAAALPFRLGSALFVVFVVSGVLRALVLLWFIPRAEEPRIRSRPELLQVIFRVARFNSISGVVLDWLTVTKK
jgi:MFS family permease